VLGIFQQIFFEIFCSGYFRAAFHAPLLPPVKEASCACCCSRYMAYLQMGMRAISQRRVSIGRQKWQLRISNDADRERRLITETKTLMPGQYQKTAPGSTDASTRDEVKATRQSSVLGLRIASRRRSCQFWGRREEVTHARGKMDDSGEPEK
jgi:hypothetical protein